MDEELIVLCSLADNKFEYVDVSLMPIWATFPGVTVANLKEFRCARYRNDGTQTGATDRRFVSPLQTKLKDREKHGAFSTVEVFNTAATLWVMFGSRVR